MPAASGLDHLARTLQFAQNRCRPAQNERRAPAGALHNWKAGAKKAPRLASKSSYLLIHIRFFPSSKPYWNLALARARNFFNLLASL